MTSDPQLNTVHILQAFSNAISAHGGSVSESFDGGSWLFARSILPQLDEVRPNDRLKSGVALHARDGDLWLHPYLYRLICSNGAIMPQTIHTEHLADLQLRSPGQAAGDIHQAVTACCAPEVFLENVRRMRSAAEIEADLALSLMPLLARLSRQGHAQLLSEIMGRFFRDRDSTRYGLINAITSTARDTKNPRTRWELEEFAGQLALNRTPKPPPSAATAPATPAASTPSDIQAFAEI